MRRTLLVVFLILLSGMAGVFWWIGRADDDTEKLTVPTLGPAAQADDRDTLTALLDAKPDGTKGPSPPEVREETREERRFNQYDRNRDNQISLNELLVSRVAAFRKLDQNDDNLLSFEEWAVTTVQRFENADKNDDGFLTRAEFAATRAKPAQSSQPQKCTCPDNKRSSAATAAMPAGVQGPPLPQTREATREERRFNQYDRNHDNRISREEMLAPRAKAFRKLDVNDDNWLTFEEWAVSTFRKFKAADRNGDGFLSRAEFATTRPKPSSKPKPRAPVCRCDQTSGSVAGSAGKDSQSDRVLNSPDEDTEDEPSFD